MGKAADFYKGLGESFSNALKRLEPFRAIVTNGNVGGKVQIQTLDSTSPLQEPYARLEGSRLDAGDEVAVINLGGRPFVLGRIQRTTNDGKDYEEPVWIQTDNVRAFRVANNADQTIFATNTTDKLVGVYNGSFLSGFSSVGGSAVWSLDSRNGNARFDGDVTIGGTATIDGRTANRATLTPPWFEARSQANSTVGNTTSTGWQTAMTVTETLPAGTWSLYAVGGQQLRHSASQSIGIRLVIGSNAGSEISQTYYADAYAQGICTNEAGGLSGSVTITLQYRCVSAGTSTSKQPWVFIGGVRTG